MLAVETLKLHRYFVYELCTEIQNNMLFWSTGFREYLQYVVEAGTGIEPVYADLQSAA